MKTAHLLLLVFGLHIALPIKSQETLNLSAKSHLAARLRQVPDQLLHTVQTPARWSPDEWALAGVAMAGITVVMLADEVLYNNILHTHSAETAHFVKFTNAFGNGIIALPAMGLMYLHGQGHKNEYTKDAAIAGAEAFLYSAGVALLLKQLTHRARPADQMNPFAWHGPFSHFKQDAFPSGHTARAFAVATVLAGYYPDRPVLGFLMFGAAGLSACGRLLSGEHWPSDVLAGALTGFVIAGASCTSTDTTSNGSS